MKGFMQGSLWALILGGAGLSIASLVSEQPRFAAGPDAPQLVAPQLEVIAPSPPLIVETTDDTSPILPPAAPLDEVADAAEAAPDVSTEPATLPQTADVASAIENPQTPENAGVSAQADAVAAPRTETGLAAPAAPVAAPSVDTATPETPVDTPSEEPSEEVVAEIVEPDVPVAVPDTETVVAQAPAPQTETSPEAETATEPEAAPVETQATAPEVQEPVETETPVVTAQEGAPATQLQAAEALPQTNTAVRINRPGTEEEPEAEVAATQPDALPDDAPALLRHAAPFEDTGASARIAIILIDSGEMPDPVNAVAALGFVPTVTVNALSSASTDLSASYRAAGIEVAMQAMLPEGAQPADVEVAFEAALGLVPDAAMFFSDGSGAMEDRAVTAQVMQVLAADGHGFVTVQRGLSNATRAAEQAGVSAITILRDIDGAGEDASAIARGLDQAAFRARQSGDAVLLGRLQPDTLEALRAWAAGLDQTSVAIAPVSAILLSDTAE